MKNEICSKIAVILFFLKDFQRTCYINKSSIYKFSHNNKNHLQQVNGFQDIKSTIITLLDQKRIQGTKRQNIKQTSEQMKQFHTN